MNEFDNLNDSLDPKLFGDNELGELNGNSCFISFKHFTFTHF